jgi:hypothetical protein
LKPEGISEIWKNAVVNQFPQQCGPVWAMFENGTLVFVPTVKYSVPEGIEEFAKATLMKNGPEVVDSQNRDLEFIVIETPNLDSTWMVKYGPTVFFWTIIDISEIPSEYHKFIMKDDEEKLLEISQLLIANLAMKKRFEDVKTQTIIESLPFPENFTMPPLKTRPIIEQID